MTAFRIAMRFLAWALEIAVVVALPYGTVAFLIEAFRGMPLNQAVVVGIAAIAAMLLLVYAFTLWVRMILSWTNEWAEGERVARILEQMRLSGRETIDAFNLQNIWYEHQPAGNVPLRRATKEGRYAVLREAVRRGWIRAPNMPQDPGVNYDCNINDAITFFRRRMWLGV